MIRWFYYLHAAKLVKFFTGTIPGLTVFVGVSLYIAHHLLEEDRLRRQEFKLRRDRKKLEEAASVNPWAQLRGKTPGDDN